MQFPGTYNQRSFPQFHENEYTLKDKNWSAAIIIYRFLRLLTFQVPAKKPVTQKTRIKKLKDFTNVVQTQAASDVKFVLYECRRFFF